MDAGFVEIAEQLIDHAPRVPEGAQEGDLGRPAAVAPDLGEDAQKLQVVVVVSDLVRDVENHGVDAGIGEHLRVLAQHVGIIREVVPEDRFAPVMRGVKRAQSGLSGFCIAAGSWARILVMSCGPPRRANPAIGSRTSRPSGPVAADSPRGTRGRAGPGRRSQPTCR